jgi:hypothetical protein
MAYVITDDINYAFIDIILKKTIDGIQYSTHKKRYPMRGEMYKTKFLAKARPYKTKEEAEKDLGYAKIILRHSTLKVKKVLKEDLNNMKEFKGWNLITKKEFFFGNNLE